MLEKKVEDIDEIKNKLKLSVELEKTKATSIQENNERLNQSVTDLNVLINSNLITLMSNFIDYAKHFNAFIPNFVLMNRKTLRRWVFYGRIFAGEIGKSEGREGERSEDITDEMSRGGEEETT